MVCLKLCLVSQKFTAHYYCTFKSNQGYVRPSGITCAFNSNYLLSLHLLGITWTLISISKVAWFDILSKEYLYIIYESRKGMFPSQCFHPIQFFQSGWSSNYLLVLSSFILFNRCGNMVQVRLLSFFYGMSEVLKKSLILTLSTRVYAKRMLLIFFHVSLAHQGSLVLDDTRFVEKSLSYTI